MYMYTRSRIEDVVSVMEVMPFKVATITLNQHNLCENAETFCKLCYTSYIFYTYIVTMLLVIN